MTSSTYMYHRAVKLTSSTRPTALPQQDPKIAKRFALSVTVCVFASPKQASSASSIRSPGRRASVLPPPPHRSDLSEVALHVGPRENAASSALCIAPSSGLSITPNSSNKSRQRGNSNQRSIAARVGEGRSNEPSSMRTMRRPLKFKESPAVLHMGHIPVESTTLMRQSRQQRVEDDSRPQQGSRRAFSDSSASRHTQHARPSAAMTSRLPAVDTWTRQVGRRQVSSIHIDVRIDRSCSPRATTAARSCHPIVGKNAGCWLSSHGARDSCSCDEANLLPACVHATPEEKRCSHHMHRTARIGGRPGASLERAVTGGC